MQHRRSPSPELEGPHQSLGLHHPYSRGHAKAWESITPTPGASGNLGVHHPKSRRYAEAWESNTPSRGARQNCGCPSPHIEGLQQTVGVVLWGSLESQQGIPSSQT